MAQSRREALKLVGVVGMGALIGLDELALAAGTPGPRQADGKPFPRRAKAPQRAVFAPLEGSDFTTTTGTGRRVTLRLAKVSDLPDAPLAAGREDSYVLVFRAPADALGAGGTYTLRQGGMAPLSVFLVRSSRPGTRTMTYSAVFNNEPVS
jgi:hypothetical protein